MRVLFVCLGNICRSPTAEGVFAKLVERAGLSSEIEVMSAGTSDNHVGQAPDERSAKHARRRGYELGHLRARQITPEMLAASDYILAMDQANADRVRRVAAPEHRGRVQLLLDYAPAQPVREVPDPYYGGDAGFEHVLDLVETASRGVLTHLQQRLGK